MTRATMLCAAATLLTGSVLHAQSAPEPIQPGQRVEGQRIPRIESRVETRLPNRLETRVERSYTLDPLSVAKAKNISSLFECHPVPGSLQCSAKP